MFHVEQFRELVVRPTLKEMDAWSQSAENLLLGTCAQESKLGTYLAQMGGGPALGIYQMEPATYKDIWENFLAYRIEYARKVVDADKIPPAEEMIWDLKLATIMCRFHYLRVPEPLPKYDNIRALGEYWKKYYNTIEGHGTVEEFVNNYMMLVV